MITIDMLMICMGILGVVCSSHTLEMYIR